ncbi:MAG: hypothetical protein NZ914_13905, partial [Gemmatales bacterium]|nr:hypothetical protein [Gemmatales bacterium]
YAIAAIRRPSSDALKKLSTALQQDQLTWLDKLVNHAAQSPTEYLAVSWGLNISLLLVAALLLLIALDFWLQRRGSLLPPRILLEK